MAIWGPTAIAASADDVHWNQSGGNVTTDLGHLRLYSDAGSSDSKFVSLRFLNVTVPAGATINSATLAIYVNASGSDSVDATNSIATVYADVGSNREDALGASHASAVSPINWTNSTASVTVAGLNTSGTKNITVTSIIQELVNLGGWASGDNICFGLDPVANTVDTYWQVQLASYDGASDIATLTIDYTEGGGSPDPLVLVPRRQFFLNKRVIQH